MVDNLRGLSDYQIRRLVHTPYIPLKQLSNMTYVNSTQIIDNNNEYNLSNDEVVPS